MTRNFQNLRVLCILFAKKGIRQKKSHFFEQNFEVTPTSLPPIKKNVIFVLDTSGSMSSESRMDRLKIAFNKMINDLNTGDTFQIVRFEATTTIYYDKFQKNTPNKVAKEWVIILQYLPKHLNTVPNDNFLSYFVTFPHLVSRF